MHFEILVEDLSGSKALKILVPKIIGSGHSYNIFSYKGLGRIPPNLESGKDASKRILLNQLPRILAGYGKTFQGYGSAYAVAVIVVCDLDRRDKEDFLKELNTVLLNCNPQPNTRFCLAIEEMEAWYLGDFNALKKAYPQLKTSILKTYINDSICDTWELLADIVCAGGRAPLINGGFHIAGLEKSNWAINISPHMDVENNNSPSFNFFRETLLELIDDFDS